MSLHHTISCLSCLLYSDKTDLERQLSQLESQSEALLGEKLSAEGTCQSLQESLRKLQFQLDELQQSKDGLQTDANTRGVAMRKLELQIGEWKGVGPVTAIGRGYLSED